MNISKVNGYLILLLHAHLPYVRHPEYEYSLEENWLFEAVRETYIPLLDLLERMVNDGISPRLTLSISPTLTEMLNDEMLRKRFVRYMDNLVELSEAEMMRTRRSPFEPVAALYNNKFRETRRLYLTRYAQDLVSAFRRLQDEGHIEIVTTAATHAFLPAFEKYPEAVRRQIKIGVKSYMNNFGKQPSGFWLPECGYYNGLDSFLKEAGIKYFFLESHGIIRGAPRPGYSIFRPALTGSGLVAFGRDFKSARQVWCASSGYPGDPSYRDFYRDIGFDLPTDYTGKFTRFGGIRTFTGMKYHCVTGRTAEKLPYNRAKAMNRAAEHAAHFINSRESDASRLAGYGFSPLIFSAFDAELFGHWWFEGIEWLEAVLRKMSESRSLRIITPAEYSSIHSAEHMEVIRPHPSSWGEGGYSSIWIGKENCHIYRHLHKMAERIGLLSGRLSCEKIRGTPLKEAVNQLIREMLLAQASDWFFLIEKERASEYAGKRVAGHIRNFNHVFSMITGNDIQDVKLDEMKRCNTIFPWLDAGG